MSCLCRDWTPTVGDPVVECHMPACKAVRIVLDLAKYQPHALPTLLLQAAGWNSGPFYPQDAAGIYLWDVTESGGSELARIDHDPRHRYFRPPGRSAYLTQVGAGPLELTFNPPAGIINGHPVWVHHHKPWLLRIGCPKEYTGMVTPLGSVITCRWEILDSKGGPT